MATIGIYKNIHYLVMNDKGYKVGGSRDLAGARRIKARQEEAQKDLPLAWGPKSVFHIVKIDC